MTRLGAWALHFAAQVVSKPSVNKFTPNLKSQFYSFLAAPLRGFFSGAIFVGRFFPGKFSRA